MVHKRAVIGVLVSALIVAGVGIATSASFNARAITVASQEVMTVDSSGTSSDAAITQRQTVLAELVINRRGRNSIISDDGRYAIFGSTATNLVADDTNGYRDIFMRDILNHTTTRISVSTSGIESNGTSTLIDVSANGRYVIFSSTATNLEDGATFDPSVGSTTRTYSYLRDTQLGTTTMIAKTSSGSPVTSTYSTYYYDLTLPKSVSDDGRFVLFESESSSVHPEIQPVSSQDATKLVMLDRRLNTWAPLRSAGGTGLYADSATAMSCDGAFVAQVTSTGVLLHDMRGQASPMLLNAPAAVTANWGSIDISCDGRYIAYVTNDVSWINGESPPYATQIALYDRLTDGVRYVGKNSDGSYITQNGADQKYVGVSVANNGSVSMTFQYDGSNGWGGYATYYRHIVRNGITGEAMNVQSSSTTYSKFAPSISSMGDRVLVLAGDSAYSVPGDTNSKDDLILLNLE